MWVPDGRDVWRAGEVVARKAPGSDGGDTSGDITLTVRPLDGGSDVMIHLTVSALAAEAGGDVSGGLAGAARSRAGGKRESSSASAVSRVMQRNIFATEDEAGFVGIDDLISLPHLNEVRGTNVHSSPSSWVTRKKCFWRRSDSRSDRRAAGNPGSTLRSRSGITDLHVHGSDPSRRQPVQGARRRLFRRDTPRVSADA